MTDMPEKNEALNVDRIEQMLIEESKLYDTLLTMAQRQSALVESEDTDALLKVLAEKSKIIERISAIEKDLKPFKENWQSVKQSLPEETLKHLEDTIRALQKTMEELLEIENQTQELVVKTKQQIGTTLRNVTTEKKVTKAYNVKTDNQNRFIDKTE